MGLRKEIIIGSISICLLLFISMDRFTLYLHRQQESKIDTMYNYIILEADSAIEEANKTISEINNLKISKEKSKKEIDSLVSKMQNEKNINISRKYAIDLFEFKIDDSSKLIDSLTEKCSILEKDLAYCPDSLKYNFIYRDSIILKYIYDTTIKEIMLVDTIKIEDPRTIKRIKNKYFD